MCVCVYICVCVCVYICVCVCLYTCVCGVANAHGAERAVRYINVKRRLDCLVGAEIGPSGVGVVIDVQQNRQKGNFISVIMRHGGYFICWQG